MSKIGKDDIIIKTIFWVFKTLNVKKVPQKLSQNNYKSSIK